MTDNDLLIEAKRIISDEIDALHTLKSTLNTDFAKAVNLIISTKKLIVTGIGKSGIIGEKIAATFSSLGKPSFFLHPVESLHGDIGIVEEDDVVILLSKSGSTEEIVRLVPYLKGRKAKLIGLVGNMNSFLAANSDAVIDCSVEKEACPLEIAPTSSTTVALAAGDALAGAYVKAMNISIEDFSRQHPLGQIGRNITLSVGDVMHKGERLPVININGNVKDAIIEISSKGLGCVCVTNEYFDLLGFITDGDIRRTLEKNDNLASISVAEILTRKPAVVSESSFLGEALALMEQRDSQISVLPVINAENKLCGIIRLHDIIRSGI